MPETIVDVAHRMREALRSFEPGCFSPADCATLVSELAATERACAAARSRAAARAVEAGAHKDQGFASGAEWLARETGSTNSDARRDIETAKTLEDHPDTKQALLDGQISLQQANEITRSGPTHERELVDLARRSGLTPLRNAARDRHLNTVDPAQLHERRLRLREHRQWQDRDGMIRYSGAWTPETGIPITNRLENEAQRLHRAARRQGRTDDTYANHLADALANMLTHPGPGRPAKTELILVCDLNAYRRGHPHPGEPCHIQGGAPIPTDLLKQLAGDAFLKVAIHDGVNIHTIAHLGRYHKTELRTALELGPPPNFDGIKCTHPDCDRRYGLEWDHHNPLNNQGPTSYDNLKPLCKPHHWQKTEQDRTNGLLAPRPPGRADTPPAVTSPPSGQPRAKHPRGAEPPETDGTLFGRSPP